MKFNKKLLSFIFLALFAVVLIGCNGDETTLEPTDAPTTTEAPTEAPTEEPTEEPTQAPTEEPTEAPTEEPTEAPTDEPTEAPTEEPTEEPTTEEPTTEEPTLPVTIEVALNTLIMLYDEFEDDTYVVTSDVTFRQDVMGYAVTWESSDTDYLANDGTVTRPTKTVGDQTLFLDVTLSYGSQEEMYTFIVTIGALEDYTDQEYADQVFLVATAFPNKEVWTFADSLILPEKGTDKDGNVYDITWSSSHPAVITAEGAIIPDDTQATTVTMTASITINDEEFTADAVFNVGIMPTFDVDTDSIATALAGANIGSYVRITGVTVIGISSNGYFYTDGEDIGFAHASGLPAEINDVVDILGSVAEYYGYMQLGDDKTDGTKVVWTVPSTEAISTPKINAGTIDTIIADGPAAAGDYKLFGMYEITGRIYYAPGNSDPVFIVPSDYDFVNNYDENSKPVGSALEIYDYANDTELIPFHGFEVTIHVIPNGYHSGHSNHYVWYVYTKDEVVAHFDTEADRIEAALNTLMYPEFIVEDTKLDMPTSALGVNFTYTSSDNTIIDPATGNVYAEALTSQVTVTITVNAESNSVTDSKVFEIKVGELQLTDISDVLDASSGKFKIEGIIISGEYQNTYFIQDATGAMALYTGSSSLETLLQNNLGNVVTITGTRGAYKGLEQINVETVDFVEAGTMPDPTNLDALELTSANLLPYQGYVVELTSMIVTDIAVDTYGNIVLTLTHLVNGTTVQAKWDSRVTLPTALDTALKALVEGDAIDIVAPLGWADGPLVYISTSAMIEKITLSDGQKLAADKAGLDFGGNLYEDTVISLPLVGTNGSTIAWAITAGDTNATLVDGDLTVTIPTEDATLEITATITLGEASDTAVFTYTLMNITKVNLGDFSSQTLGEVVAVQGVVYAVIGNGFFIEDATGALFVFSYDATYNVGDEVELLGEVASYEGSFQLSNLISLPAPLSTENSIEMEAIMYEHGTTTLVAAQLYTVIGTVAIEGSYNNVYIYVNETDKFEVYYRSPSTSIDALEAMVGEVVAVDMIYYNGGDTFAYTGETDGVKPYFEVTDFTELVAKTDGTNYDIAADSLVKITGVVTGNSFDGLFLQDANGVGFFLYKPFETGINIGDEVTYLGTVGAYNGARQLAYGASLVEVVSTGNDLIVTSVTADEINAFGEADAGTLYSFDGFTLKEIDGNTMVLEYLMADGVTTGIVNVRYYTNWDDLETIAEQYAIGAALPTIEFIVYNYRDGLVQADVLAAHFTDAEYIQFDANEVPDTLELSEDLIIPTAEFGSTYTITDITGDAATFLDYTTTPGTILVTQPAIGQADATGTMTVEVSLGTETPIVVNVALTVKAEVDLSGETTYTETFTNLDLTGTSYAAGSFVGDNSITWSYTESRGDFTLDGKAIMLDKNGDGSSLSATIQGGISSFSLDFYDAYSGAAQVELWINGTLIATSVSFDDDGDGSVYETFVVTDINISGEFTIQILAAGSQMAIDNLTWTTYTAE
ncbi:immunoglobulin-like domain-containing protein [Hujiaoplasma nucleasis]|uniref:immunoglobulin-like domain-containing protein n=1 Tax=Hujiaoplasma nucleasis TaxID=2725268 RepID=UPI00289B1009|nr:immunoglobulin-like domain-containing protein [Hujiaoplasma nucleasis]